MIETLENSSFVISKAHNTFPLCPSCVTSTSLCPLLHLLPPSPPPTHLPHPHLLTSLTTTYSPPSPPPTHLPHPHLLTSLPPPTHLPHHHLLTSLLQPLPALGDTGASITCSVLLLCVSLVGTLGQPLFQFTRLSNSTYQLPYCELFCGS